MHMIDYTLIALMRRQLENLRDRPDLIEALFSQFYCYEGLREILGPDWMKNAISIVQGNTKYAAFNKLNKEDRTLQIIPSLAVARPQNLMLTVSYGTSEDQLFFNSYGETQRTNNKIPMKYLANFTAMGYGNDDKDSPEYLRIMKIPATKENRKVVFPGQELAGPSYCGRVLEVNETASSISIVLDKQLPLDRTGKKILTGWTLQSANSYTLQTFKTSLDGANVQMLLHTVGKIELHKVYQIVVRYLLKSVREEASLMGINIQSISQSMMMQDNLSEDPSFQTSYSIQAQVQDYWIQGEQEPLDKMCLTVVACSTDPSNEMVIVSSGEHEDE